MSAIDTSWSLLLDFATTLLEEQYMPGVFDQVYRHGKTTNRLIPFAEDGEFEVESDGINIRVRTGLVDNMRMSRDALSAFTTPQGYTADKIKVRFSEDDASVNDFMRVAGSARITHFELKRRAKGGAESVADYLYDSLVPDYGEKLAIARNCPSSGIITSVSNTPHLNDSWTYATATSTATNAGGARFIVGGRIAALPANTRIDIYTTAGVVVASNVRVSDMNPADLSIGVDFISTGPVQYQSTGNLASVAATNVIYFSGTKNAGMFSMGEFFTRPTSTDAFIGGKNRSMKANRWMLPIASREGAASNATIAGSHLDDIALAMSYVVDDEKPVVCQGPLDIIQTLRGALGELRVVQAPVNDTQTKRTFTIGSNEVQFVHPHFGRVVLMGDPLCTPNTLRFIRPDSWKSYYYETRGLEILPSDSGGKWYRMQASTPNTGKGLTYQVDAMGLSADFCHHPNLNGVILNITA